MKTIFGVFAALTALIVIVPSSALSQSIETLQTRCAEKKIVINLNGIKIAETADDYCLGFLEGTFTAMRRAKLVCWEQPPDGQFLLSVLNIYVNDEKVKGADAADITAAAYQRAFPCKK